MRLYTGDELGLLKAIRIRPKTGEAAPEDDEEGEEVVKRTKGSKAALPPKPKSNKGPEVTNWNSPDRTAAIQHLAWSTPSADSSRGILSAHADGHLEHRSVTDGAVVRRWDAPAPWGKDTRYVGLHTTAERLITCTNEGALTVRSVTSGDSPSVFALGKDLCRSRLHSTGLVAVGGKEHDLSVWDIEHASPTTFNSTPAFRAKNVPDDSLRLRVPVCINDLVFLDPKDPRHIATGTAYKQVRVYDTREKRRPVRNYNFGDKAVRSIETMESDPNVILISDTIGNLSSFDTRTGLATGSYKGFAGTATAMASSADRVASASMDRHVRVHNADGARSLLHKVYLKQRLTAVLFDDEDIVDEEEEEKEFEDDLWGADRGDGSSKRKTDAPHTSVEAKRR